MILDQTAHTLQRGSLAGERQFGIALSPKIYSMMSDKLYTDRIGSVVREVCSNAWDGMKMKSLATGQPIEPFSVTLPTDLEPHFIVEDFGVGMPDAAAQDLYSTLGLSTKEGSNDQIGAFGLGSKSPFAVTDTFTVENTYEGITHYYLCFKSESGLPSLLKTGQKTEDRPNGVKVIIPSSGSNYSQYKSALQRQLVAMEPKPNINNIEDFIFVEPQRIAENEFGYILGNASKFGLMSKKAYVRMGMVLYPVDDSQIGFGHYDNHVMYRKFGDGSALILHMNIGDVEPLPSREALTYDPRTKKNILAKLEQYKAIYKKILIDQIMQEKTPLDAYNRILDTNTKTGIDLMRDGIYINGWPINSSLQPNVFPKFQHSYQVEELAAPVVPPMLPQPPKMKTIVETQTQFVYEAFQSSDLRLNTRRNQEKLGDIYYNFLNDINKGTHKFLLMDEEEPKHRISRMKSVLNKLSYRDNYLVVKVNPNYPGPKTDFTDFLRSLNKAHPGLVDKSVTFFSEVEKPESVRNARSKEADPVLAGLTICYPNDIDKECDFRKSDLQLLSGQSDLDEDEYDRVHLAIVDQLKTHKFEKNCFYIDCLRSDPIGYTNKLDRFKKLALSLGMYIVIVRRGGIDKIDTLVENGVLEFKAAIDAKMEGAVPSDDFKRKSSCQSIISERADLFGAFKSRIFKKLQKQLAKDGQYVHPLFTKLEEIIALSNKSIPQTSTTRMVHALKSEGFIQYFTSFPWAKESEIDMTPELDEAFESFKTFYPVMPTLIAGDHGYGNEDYCPIKYQYITDYNNLRSLQQKAKTPDVVVTPY